MGYLELYHRKNTCIEKSVEVVLFFPPKKVELYDHEWFSVLLWSFNAFVFLFKES
jgi:hypothetical protein